MPIPYMGSKSSSAHTICNVIEANYPNNNKIVVDLFCGGFAIGQEFYKRGYKVIANDKNKYVIALLNQIINKGLDEKKCLEWVSMEKFKDVLKNKSKYEDWYVGYIMCIWSFGNNQKDYLYGKDIADRKRSLCELIINKKIDAFCKSIIPNKYIQAILSLSDWHKRRIASRKVLSLLSKRYDISNLQNLQSLESLQNLQSLESLQRLESLIRVESLQSLTSVKSGSDITFISKNYNEINIPRGSIVYCDPPYKGTREYAEGGFNYDMFWDYVRQLSTTNKVFVSEYSAPDDFISVYSFSRKSTLQQGHQSHNNQPKEKLFIKK